ncbi:MAG: PDZ domain-containing protein [candidate division Zixibacteria bacterium]|nr:PDZ domain-containing protein [candidate division Zixibacteria bacterium]
MSKRSIVILILLAFLTSMITATPVKAKEYKERSKRGWLGVYIQDVTTDIKEAMDLKSKRGILIRDVVEDSPADEAGIKQEDLILRFGGEKVMGTSHFTKMVRGTSPEEEVELIILRDGKEKIITVTLGKRRMSEFFYEYEFEPFLGETERMKPHVYSFSFFSGSRIGVKVQDMTEQLGNYFGVEDGEGALITEVEEDMPAERVGLKAGDVIVEVDGEEIDDTEDLMEIISDKEEGDKVGIKVIRNRKPESFVVEVEEEEEWSSFDFGGLKKLKILPEKLHSTKIFLEKEFSSELEEELEELREDLEELKEELEDLKEKIR